MTMMDLFSIENVTHIPHLWIGKFLELGISLRTPLSLVL